MKNRGNNSKRVVKGGKAFTEARTPLGKKEVELAKANRVRDIERIDKEIADLTARKESIVAQASEDDSILSAIEGGGDFG